MRGDAFLRLRAAEAEHLERERDIERRPRHAQPIVQRILRPAKRGLRAGRELARYLECLCLELAFFAGQRYQAEALGLLAADLLAKEQVVLRLGHAAEERPDDRRVIAGGDAEARVAVDQARVP